VDTLIHGSTFKGNISTKYGQVNEPKALAKYMDIMKEGHSGCKLKTSGLVISDRFDYLGASPDSIFECSCHGKRLVEVKCPYTLTDKNINISDLDFVKMEENDQLSLKHSGNSYYDQIQGQMGVTGIKNCDLVVYSKKDIAVIQVPFEETHWKLMASKLTQFHSDFVYPALYHKKQNFILNKVCTDHILITFSFI